jgi:putative transposase
MSGQGQFRRGRHVVSKLNAHLVFVTKYRRACITDAVWASLVCGFKGTAAKLNVQILELNHGGDHVHLLIEYPPQRPVSEIVNSLKGVSSRIVRRDCRALIRHALWGEHFWSPSYFVASCGGAPLQLIQQYVESQRSLKPSTPP